MPGWLRQLREGFRSDEVLGMNRRNLQYIQGCNPRARYVLADDKCLAKAMLEKSGLPVPQTLAIVERRNQFDEQIEALQSLSSFVMKPSKGFGGSGVLVAARAEGRFVRPSGKEITLADLRLHMAWILAGMFALDHVEDRVLIEERVCETPLLSKIHGGVGVSDLRVIVHQGIPVMAMLRLPCRGSGGTANLHQHGLGLGVDLDTGRTHHAIQDDQPIDLHPDTQLPLSGIELPAFEQAINASARVNRIFGMDYLGVDIVFDAERGPLILEVNVRPGLAIQLANRTGLRAELEA